MNSNSIKNLKKELDKVFDKETNEKLDKVIDILTHREKEREDTHKLIEKLVKEIKEDRIRKERQGIEAMMDAKYINSQMEEIAREIKELKEEERKVKEVVVRNQVAIPEQKEFPDTIKVENFPESDAPKIVRAIKELGSRIKQAGRVIVGNEGPREAVPVRLVDREGRHYYNAQMNMGGISFDTSDLENNTRVPSSIGSGRKEVASAGSRERLVMSSTACKYVDIMAEVSNTGYIVVGGSGVVAAEATRSGIPLYAGQSIRIEIDDLYKIHIDSTVDGEGVTFIYYS